MRLDSGLWGPLGTLPDEPPVEDEQRSYADEQELRAIFCTRCHLSEWDCKCQPVDWP